MMIRRCILAAEAAVIVMVLCVLGCNSSGRQGRPLQQELQPSRPLTHEDIWTRVDALPSWPTESPYLSDEQWLLLARTGEEMQHVDPTTLRESLTEYLERPHEFEDESKIVLLLRVMFNLPSEPYDEKRHPVLVHPGGFMAWHESGSDEDIMLAANLVSWPIRWTHEGPELVGTLGGYKGPPYDVGNDIIEMRENYGFRDLKPIIEQLEHKAGLDRR